MVAKGLSFSDHLDQFRHATGAKRFRFAYDPRDCTNASKSVILWARNYAEADAVANQMSREFQLGRLRLEEEPCK